jgi:hypothetical protein
MLLAYPVWVESTPWTMEKKCWVPQKHPPARNISFVFISSVVWFFAGTAHADNAKSIVAAARNAAMERVFRNRVAII